MKKVVAALAATVTVVAVMAGSASAGEITGNGTSLKVDGTPADKWGTGLHARSECAYSGRNDENILFEPGDEEYQAERTQSWGQIVRTLTPIQGLAAGGAAAAGCKPAPQS
jgi:hypothetical protein